MLLGCHTPRPYLAASRTHMSLMRNLRLQRQDGASIKQSAPKVSMSPIKGAGKVSPCVLVTCAQASFPPRRAPVTSWCKTGTYKSAALMCCSTGARTGARTRAAYWIQPTSVPLASRILKRSASSCCTRPMGEMLLLDQIDGERTHPRTVLCSAGHLSEKGARADISCTRPIASTPNRSPSFSVY
jgi:hypothetical protein